MTLLAKGSVSVLVAEDDRVMSDVIRFKLDRAGYLVTVARSGSDAWQLLQEQQFEMLVTDYQMPGMSGEELCRAFRAKYPDSEVPIIFISARGLELDVPRMKKELKIEALLFKPFSPRELVEAIDHCVSRTPHCV